MLELQKDLLKLSTQYLGKKNNGFLEMIKKSTR